MVSHGAIKGGDVETVAGLRFRGHRVAYGMLVSSGGINHDTLQS